MKEFIYQEKKHINATDYNDFNNLMSKYDFYPEGIQDEKKFRTVFDYLCALTVTAPDFLLPFEYALSMLERCEQVKEIKALKEDLERRLFEACERIAVEENIFTKKLEWGWHENRPLIRGFFRMANKRWKNGEIEKAHNLFSQLYKTNENDQIGVRYVMKATGENMKWEEFEERFVIKGDDENYYQYPKVENWFNDNIGPQG